MMKILLLKKLNGLKLYKIKYFFPIFHELEKISNSFVRKFIFVCLFFQSKLAK